LDIDKAEFIKILKEKLANTDINIVRQDVISFVQNPGELEIWSNDYFLLLAARIKYV